MKDPVCGMDVTPQAKYLSVWKDEQYAFCSPGCKSKFDADPSVFLEGRPSGFTVEKPDFKPLFMILGGILFLTIAKYFLTGRPGFANAMYDFMGVFFVVFGGFKLLDVKGFADAYATYDVVARKSRIYALIYPFLEVALGIFYLYQWNVDAVNWATLIVMSVSSIGVAQALKNKKKIQCACLGTKIKLPMTKITLLEDVLMLIMALGMILIPNPLGQ